MEMVNKKTIETCNEQKLLVKHVEKCFQTEDIYVDEEQFENYLGLIEYMPFEKLFEWEEFAIGLHLCTYWRKTGLPRWPDLFLYCGRGAGKDGFISFESMCLTSPYNPIKRYDVDICANAEDQAVRPVADLSDTFENSKHKNRLAKFFYWTKQSIKGKANGGVIRGRTNNPKSKDGMRSGMVVFNEMHQYENYDNITVFITGLGKVAHPRRLYATTDGIVRDGPLDAITAIYILAARISYMS